MSRMWVRMWVAVFMPKAVCFVVVFLMISCGGGGGGKSASSAPPPEGVVPPDTSLEAPQTVVGLTIRFGGALAEALVSPLSPVTSDAGNMEWLFVDETQVAVSTQGKTWTGFYIYDRAPLKKEKALLNVSVSDSTGQTLLIEGTLMFREAKSGVYEIQKEVQSGQVYAPRVLYFSF